MRATRGDKNGNQESENGSIEASEITQIAMKCVETALELSGSLAQQWQAKPSDLICTHSSVFCPNSHLVIYILKRCM